MISLVVLVLELGCGSGAIVRTHPGGVYEGRIQGSDRETVFISGQKILRREIEDIDHPGNVAAVLGTIVAAIGAFSAIPNCSETQRAEDPTPCSSSGVWLLTGIPIAIYGFVTHSESVDRAGE